MNFLDSRLPERFWKKVHPCPMSGCWLFVGHCDRLGYGRIGRTGGGVTTAHRFAYEGLVGPVPPGLELDHRACSMRSCCNPAHLEAVTHKTNMERGAHALKTKCPGGHQYDEINTIRYQGRRYCGECNRVRNRERMRRKRAA